MTKEIKMTTNVQSIKNKRVSVYTEWDPLEEVIVGVIDGATVPEWDMILEATMPTKHKAFYQKFAGSSFPEEQIKAANKDLNEFIKILQGEGVTVTRPDVYRFNAPYSTPDWSCPGGLYAAMPRDVLLVFGDEIIECPMAWKSRFFEVNAYRSLLKEYFLSGARWVSAPKPQLTTEIYNPDYTEVDSMADIKYAISEFEPTFDAADFIRVGKDIVGQRSHVTNQIGIEWLRRHLGDRFNVHEIEVDDLHPMHIDATLMPLAPGKLLINPERLTKIPEIFKHWDIFEAPEPCLSDDHILYMTSKWINMNILMLDEKRVIVEKEEESIYKAFKSWGFTPIKCSFKHFNTFGGSFHCATLDVRRRGDLKSYT